MLLDVTGVTGPKGQSNRSETMLSDKVTVEDLKIFKEIVYELNVPASVKQKVVLALSMWWLDYKQIDLFEEN